MTDGHQQPEKPTSPPDEDAPPGWVRILVAAQGPDREFEPTEAASRAVVEDRMDRILELARPFRARDRAELLRRIAMQGDR